MEQLSLWGEEFTIKEEDLKNIINKSKAKKVVKEVSLEKKLKSKSVSVEEKMELIEQDVNKILGKYKDDVVLPNFPEDVKWNNKKWRMWLHFSDNQDMIFAGRQYPFFTSGALDFLRDKILASKELKFAHKFLLVQLLQK